ncbi:MAG: hypothetical protein QOF53_91 [Nocardioidaceae bacterium]|nr:hypothetical protein [Nocardioidaceae bacterium]
MPAFLNALVDDAAVFPPGNAPLEQAVRDHASHRAAAYADLVGPLVVADRHLPALRDLVRDPARALRIAVVVTGGAGAIDPAVRWASSPGLELAAVEISMRESDAGDLAPNAQRIVTAVDSLVQDGALHEDVPVYVEAPRWYGDGPSPSWSQALDTVAAADHRLKLRTGGADKEAFPSAAELAGWLRAALDRELRFKCTAGLHHAVRHRDPVTGFEHHGFLNVLLATRADLDGGSPEDVAAVLDTTDTAELLAAAEPAALTSARRWFTSFGSCSVAEPLADLAGLGLLG